MKLGYLETNDCKNSDFSWKLSSVSESGSTNFTEVVITINWKTWVCESKFSYVSLFLVREHLMFQNYRFILMIVSSENVLGTYHEVLKNVYELKKNFWVNFLVCNDLDSYSEWNSPRGEIWTFDCFLNSFVWIL